MDIKKILLVVLVLGVVGGAFGVYQCNRKNSDLSSAKADFSINAPALMSEFSDNEAKANTKYLNKIVQVRGLITKIDKDSTGSFSIYLESGSELGVVSCLLDTRHNDEGLKLHTNDSVTINGVCAGLNLDVLLVRCSVQ